MSKFEHSLTRAEKIQAILNARNSHLPAARHKLDTTQRLMQRLHDLTDALETVAENGLMAGLGTIHEFVAKLGDVTPQLADATRSLASLIERFQRNYLTLAVMGEARQGKSTLLQALTGLDDRLIPSGNLTDMTGTQSWFFHTEGKPTAKVHTYSVTEFLELIGDYFREIGLEPVPTTLDEFEHYQLPEDPEQGVPAEVKDRHVARGIYQWLYRLWDDLRYYRDVLETKPVQEIELRDVPAWVTFLDDRGRRQHKVHAVRRVEIRSQFPTADVGQLRVIDTRGLDGISLGTMEQQLQVVKQEAEIVLIVSKPNDDGDRSIRETLAFYDRINKTLPLQLRLDQIGFFIFNKTLREPGNEQVILALKPQLEKQVNSQRVLIVDCRDPESVHQELLDPVLDYLIQNVSVHDATRLSACTDDLKSAVCELEAPLQAMLSWLGNQRNRLDPQHRFHEEFETIFRQVVAAFRAVRNQAWQDSQAPTPEFEEELRRAFHRAQEVLVASADVLQQEASGRPTGGLKAVLAEHMDRLRARLADCFKDLWSQSGNRSVNELLSSLVAALKQTGQLGALLRSSDGRVEFRQLAQLCDESQARCLHLEQAFLTAAELDVRFGRVLSIVRRILVSIDPDLYVDEDIRDEDPVQVIPTRARLAATTLIDAHKNILAQLENSLDAFAPETSSVVWAIVAELFDELIVADGIKDEWQRFYEYHRNRIWPDDYERAAELQASLAQVHVLTREVKELAAATRNEISMQTLEDLAK